MRDITAFMAQPTGGQTIEPVRIEILEPIPRLESINQQMMLYRSDAEIIWKALESCLPGGTLSRIRALAAQSAVNQLIIREDTEG